MPCAAFITYAGPDRADAAALAEALEAVGVSTAVDTRLLPGDRWDVALTGALAQAEMIIVLLGPAWRQHDAWYAHDEVARAIVRARDDDDRVRLVPVLTGALSPLDMPSGLARLVPLRHAGPDWRATAAALAALHAGQWTGDGAAPGARTDAGPRLSTSRLPTPGRDFVGRAAELALLDAAWEAPRRSVQTIIGVGGEGKTALVHRWLHRMALDDYRGAARVYAWSFSSQGAGEDRQTSADLFIAQLSAWLGETGPAEADPWARGVRLAARIREQKTLLILDGVEPLQHPPGPSAGRLKDPALSALLIELAARMDGLCVVTSRLPLADTPPSETVSERRLPALDPAEGAALLRARGVVGESDELEAATTEMKGHALALHLLGGYLAMYEAADIRRRDRIEGLREAEDGGDHARRVMDAYARWLDPADVAALRVVGLFDRAADPPELAAVLADPPIDGLTDAFDGADGRRWKKAVAHLRAAGLLLPGERADALDAHPLVREHFGEALRAAAPAAWAEAHGRLYAHFAGAAPDQPDDLPGLEPLYRAVHHGCAAGRHREARAEVFRRRIKRGNEHYSANKLGAHAADLAALAAFFDPPWRRPHPALRPAAQAWVLADAAFALRALGRLAEAVAPLEAALDRYIAQQNWNNAAINAGNLAELLLTLGRLDPARPAPGPAPRGAPAPPSAADGALARARQAVDLADRSGDAFMRMGNRTTLADALHQRGRLAAARALFAEAERMQAARMQAARQPGLPRLSSLGGYQYGDLLLPTAPAEARRRAEWMLPLMRDAGWLLDVALAHLLLGRAALTTAAGPADPDFALARHHLDAAVTGLRKAGHQWLQPPGLLTRAALHRLAADWPAAAQDLAEARRIAERGGMRLHLADVDLESARLALARDDHPAARAAYAAACAEVEATAYHRRDPELADLAAALALPPPDWLDRADIPVDLPPTPDLDVYLAENKAFQVRRMTAYIRANRANARLVAAALDDPAQMQQLATAWGQEPAIIRAAATELVKAGLLRIAGLVALAALAALVAWLVW